MLSKELQALETVAKIKCATSVEEIFELLAGSARSCNLPYVLITGVPLLGQKLSDHVIISGWPKQWLERYNNNDYVLNDPVARQICRSTKPFQWSKIEFDKKKKPKAQLVMDEAREFSMRDGFTVPIYGFDGYQACVTMGGSHFDLSPDDINSLHIISLIAFSAAKGLIAENPPPGTDDDDDFGLSEREIEVLKWTSVGKTSWDVAQILSLSENTIEKHIAAIARKLNAINKAHSVAKALRHGLIN